MLRRRKMPNTEFLLLVESFFLSSRGEGTGTSLSDEVSPPRNSPTEVGRNPVTGGWLPPDRVSYGIAVAGRLVRL